MIYLNMSCGEQNSTELSKTVIQTEKKDTGTAYGPDRLVRNVKNDSDGTILNPALAIYEDRAGNIWFSSGGGATRYDGNSFRNRGPFIAKNQL